MKNATAADVEYHESGSLGGFAQVLAIALTIRSLARSPACAVAVLLGAPRRRRTSTPSNALLDCARIGAVDIERAAATSAASLIGLPSRNMPSSTLSPMRSMPIPLRSFLNLDRRAVERMMSPVFTPACSAAEPGAIAVTSAPVVRSGHILGHCRRYRVDVDAEDAAQDLAVFGEWLRRRLEPC